MKKYRVIYADPPWSFATYSHKGKGRSAEAHYDCMTLEDIKALPVADWAADDCALLLWATDPLLEKAFDVISAWGFTYKTVGFYWAKQNKSGNGFFMGTGYYTRANPEQCLLSTRGKPKRLSRSVQKLVVSPRREHSRKPDCVRDRIEALFDGPYLEMFARSTKPGWDAWGNEISLLDDGSTPVRRWHISDVERPAPGSGSGGEDDNGSDLVGVSR